MAFKPVTIRSTSAAQLQLGFDAANVADFTVNSGGDLTIAPSGGDTAITGTLAVTGVLDPKGDILHSPAPTFTIGTNSTVMSFDLDRDNNGGAELFRWQIDNGTTEWMRLRSGALLVGNTDVTNVSAGDARLGGALWIGDAITAPTARTGFAAIYVDTADGDLKVRFGDGTTKTIATDT